MYVHGTALLITIITQRLILLGMISTFSDLVGHSLSQGVVAATKRVRRQVLYTFAASMRWQPWADGHVSFHADECTCLQSQHVYDRSEFRIECGLLNPMKAFCLLQDRIAVALCK
jgi:hypothetical protein